MLLKDVIGQEHAVRILKNSLKGNRVAHAYLFLGPEGVGKGTITTALAQALVCKTPDDGEGCGSCLACQKAAHLNHPDIHYLVPAGAAIKIEQVRELQKSVYYAAYEGPYKIFIIKQVDTMTQEAANSFLKILEEPPGDTVFLLTAAQTYSLLPTIISRCQVIHLHKIPLAKLTEVLSTQNNLEIGEAKVLATLADGSLGKAQQLLNDGQVMANRQQLFDLLERLKVGGPAEALKGAEELEGSKEVIIPLLDLLLFWFRDIFLYQQLGDPSLLVNLDREALLEKERSLYSQKTLGHILQAIEETKKKISMNANIRLALEVLLLDLQQCCQ